MPSNSEESQDTTRRQRPTALRIAQALVWALLLATLVAFAGSWHWYFDLFSHFRPQYIVMLGLLSIALLLAKRWIMFSMAIAGVALNVVELLPYGDWSYDSNESAAGKVAHLRFVSLNLLQGNLQHHRVEQFLRRADADIILLQEVSPRWATVLRGMSDAYPEQFIHAKKNSKGAALLTRLTPADMRFEPMPGDGSTGALTGELRTHTGTAVVVIGVHSHKPTSAAGAASQRRYFSWLGQKASEAGMNGRPVIVLGDFNSTPSSSALKMFTRGTGLANTSSGAFLQATWKVNLPHQVMIDHGFVSQQWRVRSRKIGPGVGSDHRPLILDLTLVQ